jgi:hypothetical protein
MIIKIDTCKIKHQLKVEMFVWNCDNLLESKLKKIIKINLKSIKY